MSSRLVLGLAAALLIATSTVVSLAAKGQCDMQDGQCSGSPSVLMQEASPTTAVPTEAEGADVSEQSGQSTKGRSEREPVRIEDLGFWRVGVVLMMLGGVVFWILCTIKFAIDGSLPARLALWGFLPEAYAAISVRAVVALIRLKSNPTPVIVLRNCVTDADAVELAEGLRRYGETADVQALEFPHNPKLGREGVRALVAVAMSEGSNLQELDFSYNPQLEGFVITELLPLFPSKVSKINTLKLADCGLNQAAVQKLGAGLQSSAIRTLDLSLNPLGGAGEALSTVCEAPVLDEITLTCCSLRVADVSAIAEQLPFTSIKCIQLGGNRIGAAGLAALVEHLPTSQIDELGLESNDLEAKDLSILAEAWVKRPFSRVRLSGNRMSNEEIAAFVNTLKTLHS